MPQIERSKSKNTGPVRHLEVAPDIERPIGPSLITRIINWLWVIVPLALVAYVYAYHGMTTVTATLDDKPVKLAVYLDGKKIGMTPLETRLPLDPMKSHTLSVGQPKVQLEGLQFSELRFWTVILGVKFNAEFTSAAFMNGE